MFLQSYIQLSITPVRTQVGLIYLKYIIIRALSEHSHEFTTRWILVTKTDIPSSCLSFYPYDTKKFRYLIHRRCTTYLSIYRCCCTNQQIRQIWTLFLFDCSTETEEYRAIKGGTINNIWTDLPCTPNIWNDLSCSTKNIWNDLWCTPKNICTDLSRTPKNIWNYLSCTPNILNYLSCTPNILIDLSCTPNNIWTDL
jgi:hypothetical protein